MQSQLLKPRRSLLFVPGNRLTLYTKALKTAADVVCIDLEDSIPTEQKDETRKGVINFFQKTSLTNKTEIVLRINSLQTREGIADINALLESKSAPHSIMLTKIDNAEEVKLIDKILSTPTLATTRIQVIVETNSGLDDVMAIAHSSERIDTLLFGGVDMVADLRSSFDWDSLLYSRSKIIHAGASADIDTMDMPELDIDNLRELEQTTTAVAKLGFTGKAAIHPTQIPIINRCFTPSEETINTAKRVVDAYEASKDGLTVVDGKLLEKPFVRSMYRILKTLEKDN